MKIRHVACIAPPKLGGIGTAALRMVEGLVARGHQAELVVPGIDGQVFEGLVRPWPVRYAWGNAAALADVPALFEDVDVLHLHYPFTARLKLFCGIRRLFRWFSRFIWMRWRRIGVGASLTRTDALYNHVSCSEQVPS